MLKKSIFVFLLFLLLPSGADAEIYHYTLLEKTRGAELIVLAKYETVKDETYDLESNTFPRFAEYRITEVWKGIRDEDTILLDFKHTNDKYAPFICRPAVHPIPDERVILFLEKDFTIFAGFQGKIVVDANEIPLYRETIEKFLELDTFQGRERVLKTLEMVDDDTPHVKESILRELHNIDRTAYGLELAGLLDNKDVLVRRSAINALVGTGDERTVPFALAALNDPDSEVRARATSVLGSFDDEGITSALMEAFNDPDPMVRMEAVFSLSHRNSREAIPIYLMALTDEDPLVREYGVNAFEWVRHPDVMPEILKALNDENGRVRASAIRTLYVNIRIGAVEPDAGIINSVSLLLEDRDSLVRAEAAYALSEIGNITVIPSLEKALKREQNESVLRKLQHALELLKGKE